MRIFRVITVFLAVAFFFLLGIGFADKELPDVSEEGIRIDGIGMGQKGYVFYRMISPEWYLVDMYVPT